MRDIISSRKNLIFLQVFLLYNFSEESIFNEPTH